MKPLLIFTVVVVAFFGVKSATPQSSFDAAPIDPSAVFAALENRYGKMDGRAYVITKTRIIPCFGIGPHDNAPLPCVAAIAESSYATCRDLLERYSVKGYGCDADLAKYEKAKAAAAYCAYCGPTGPLGPTKGR